MIRISIAGRFVKPKHAYTYFINDETRNLINKQWTQLWNTITKWDETIYY